MLFRHYTATVAVMWNEMTCKITLSEITGPAQEAAVTHFKTLSLEGM
jgi:hypothetical protein